MTIPPNQPTQPGAPDPSTRSSSQQVAVQQAPTSFSLRSELRSFLPLYGLILVYVSFNIFVSGLLPGKGNCSLDQAPHTNFLENLLYAPLTHYKFSAKPSPDVVLVTMSEGSEPGSALENPCVGRQFLADLIGQLRREGAKVIAIDKNFQAQGCTTTEGDIFDANLKKTLNQVGSQIPIILGQRTDLRAGAKQEDDCLVQGKPYVPAMRASNDAPGPVAAAGIYYGLTRLNSNSLRIPLQWWLFESGADAANLHDQADLHINGFALEAASSFDKHILDRPDLRKPLSESEHPYGTFAKKLNEIHAIDIVCRNQTRDDPKGIDWECGDHPTTGHASDVHGKLVVIGQLSTQDRVQFTGGEEYGSRLQANYVSSLLEDSYIRRVPVSVDIIMFIILIALPLCIDYFWPPESQPKWPHPFVAFLIAVVFLVLLGALFLFVGKLFAPVAFLSLYGGATGLIGRGLDAAIRRVRSGTSPSIPDNSAGASS